MIDARHERPGRLTILLMRLQYWYDRLTEPRRLLVGLLSILFLGASLLYVLGFTSTILVSRIELRPDPTPSTAEPPSPAPVVGEAQPTPAPNEPTPVPAAPTATPAVDAGGSLIQPPDVPEVAIIPVPPRIYEPQPQPQPLKPRVVATPVAPARTSAPSAATAVPTRASGNAAPITPGPTPQRTVVPTNGIVRTPTPVRAQQAPPPGNQPAAPPTRAPASTQLAPPVPPRATAPAVQPTPRVR